jgi:anti-sigma B factor antagonist
MEKRMTKHRLDVSAEERGSETYVFTLAGDLYGTSEGYAFQENVRKTISEGHKRIVLDLNAVNRIDSSGIGILVALMFSAYNSGGGMVLAALQPKVKELLSMVMLLERIEHADSVDQAITRLGEMKLSD